ncbi:glycosyltransferase family 2 protein [Chryseobacterium wangxinyae]|uniref:glycosyltransferase family 2 protein n=1 Tax=Chryseobacterium sp. CY353 TaxID=2997334 RepID=UPI00226F4ACB|nr:glycosyltransferase family 2 protein [Chryseobacterium sp. CY353]MCY0970070.1 glycosyltransferase family 2 protein [Chryseobacterium sp. CY353]
MDISVIIVNYNTLNLTKTAIDSIFEFSPKNLKLEIFVVDNASSDGSKEYFKNDNRITYIYSEDNLGFGKANNIAIERSQAKYIFLLNSDAYLIEDVLTSFYDFMENPENKNVACCGANIIDGKGDRAVIGGNLPTVIESISRVGFAVFFLSYYKRHLASGIKHFPDKGDLYEIGCVTGANMFLRRSVLKETGAFDPDFFLYYEETEMSFRFKKHGYKSYILANHTIVHLEGSSSKKPTINEKVERFFSQGRYLYFEKSYGRNSARFITSLFVIQSVLFGLFKFKKDHFTRAKIIFNTLR